MATMLTLSLDRLEVESFETAELDESGEVRLDITQVSGCTREPNCEESAYTCLYGPGCGTEYPNCDEVGSGQWWCWMTPGCPV